MTSKFTRVIILSLLGLILGNDVFADQAPLGLFEALGDKRYKIRIQAAATLAATKDKRARSAIEKLLADEEFLVRAAACDALMALGDPDAIAAIEPLSKDNEDLVRRRARLAVRVLRGLKKTQKKPDAMPGPVEPVDVNDRDLKRDQITPNAITRRVVLEGVNDQSKSAYKGLIDALRVSLEAELKNQDIASNALKRRYALMAQVREVVTRVGDKESTVQVSCHLTVSELPRHTLRLSNQVTTGATVDGRASEKELAELAGDAVKAAGEALMKDFMSWAVVQSAP